jgi:hypothetical protein
MGLSPNRERGRIMPLIFSLRHREVRIVNEQEVPA